MIQANQAAAGQRLEIVDTPSPLASLLSGAFRVGIWLGAGLGLIAAVGLVVDLVRGDPDPWTELEMVGNGLVLALIGWGGARGWRRLATVRRTIVDRQRGTIEIIEKPAGAPAQTRQESWSDVRAVRITASETSGPQGTSLRMHRLWLALAHDRTLLLGDVGDVGGAVASLERAAATTAAFLGVPIERVTQHDIPPTAARVLSRVPIDRSYALMSWRQRLMYVPGIAIVLCGSMYLLLVLFDPVKALDCTRADVITCTLSETTRLDDGTPIVFELDRADIHTHTEEHTNDSGKHYTVSKLVVTPEGGEPIEMYWAEEAELRAFADDDTALAFHDDDDPKPILMPIFLALTLLVPLIPMLTLGGTLRIRRTADTLEARAPMASARVPLGSGPATLEVHRMHGRWRSYARLTCTTSAGSFVLVKQAPHDALQRIADDLAR